MRRFRFVPMVSALVAAAACSDSRPSPVEPLVASPAASQRVYVVVWGSQWLKHNTVQDSAGTIAQLSALYSQEQRLGGVVYDNLEIAPTHPTAAEFAAEARKIAELYGRGTESNRNVYYVIETASGARSSALIAPN